MAATKKPCEKCGRVYRTTNLSRHRRTCTGRKPTNCGHCGRTFRYPCLLVQHLYTCKLKRDCERREREIKLEAQLDAVRAEVAALRVKIDQKDARLERNAQQLDEKDQQLHDKDQQLAAANKQLSLLARPSSVINLSVLMRPWCIDPSNATSYNACLSEDADWFRREFVPKISLAQTGDDFKVQQKNRCDVTRLYLRVLRSMAFAQIPRYIVTDVSRKKGMFVMPDGSCRFDHNLEMYNTYGVDLYDKVLSANFQRDNALWIDSDEYQRSQRRNLAAGQNAKDRLCCCVVPPTCVVPDRCRPGRPPAA